MSPIDRFGAGVKCVGELVCMKKVVSCGVVISRLFGHRKKSKNPARIYQLRPGARAFEVVRKRTPSVNLRRQTVGEVAVAKAIAA